MAHNLRLAQPSAKITLVVKNGHVFHNRKHLLAPGGLTEGPELKVKRTGGDKTESSGYEIDITNAKYAQALGKVIEDGTLGTPQPGGPIDSLIVCTKTPATSSAIEGIHSRISPSTVISLLQNGMGVYDELCAKFWPEPAERPQFILGTTTHGVTPVEPGSIIHATRPGEGAVKWGVVEDPRGFDTENWLWGRKVSDLPPLTPPDSPRLIPPPPPGKGLDNVYTTLQALLSMSALNPSLLPMPHIFHELLLKLAVNATINPLTAVLGGGYLTNGSLYRTGPGHRLVRQTIEETSAVLQAYLRDLPGGALADTIRRFSPDGIQDRVNAVIAQTRDNFSSMAMDVKSGRYTEIDYINGYICSLGQRVNIPTPTNRMLIEMVKFKAEVGGLGPRFQPAAIKRLRQGEKESFELRKLALDERRVALQERELLIRETRWTEAKRAQRALKKEVRQRERAAKLATSTSATPGAETGLSGSESSSSWETASDK